MQSFLTRYQSEVKGTLSGFDRVRFRGIQRWLSTVHGLMSFLWSVRVLLKDFTDWSKELTGQLKTGGQQTVSINGFRNRDLRALLFGTDDVPADEAQRQAAKVTRLLRLLRGHHLIRKVCKTHRYQLTEKGRTVITAVLAAQQAGTKQLAELAA